jgi:hypothetical protein
MTNPVIVSNFRVDELKKYALGPGVEIKLSSQLPAADAPTDVWRTSAIGTIVIIVNDPDVALQLQIHLGKPVKITFEIDNPLISVLKTDPDALRSGLEARPVIHHVSPVEMDTAPFNADA